jgi:hypothetical protein
MIIDVFFFLLLISWRSSLSSLATVRIISFGAQDTTSWIEPLRPNFDAFFCYAAFESELRNRY